jgi:DNA/RNA-binding domain of Phe-tRNA-synthetase-like protein
MKRLSLDPSVEKSVLAGVAWFSGVNAASDNPHWNEMDELEATLRAAYAGRKPSEIPGLEPARILYRRFGVDPTRTRPSSEALLRRVLRDRSLYRINRLVDAINWASLALLLPIGLYDLDATEGDLTIRVGGPGESYEGIRRGEINLEGRLVIADERGACGSPTADSLRTCVTETTTRAVAVILAPAGLPRLQMEEGLQRLSDRVTSWCGGTADGAFVLAGDAS